MPYDKPIDDLPKMPLVEEATDTATIGDAIYYARYPGFNVKIHRKSSSRLHGQWHITDDFLENYIRKWAQNKTVFIQTTYDEPLRGWLWHWEMEDKLVPNEQGYYLMGALRPMETFVAN